MKHSTSDNLINIFFTNISEKIIRNNENPYSIEDIKVHKKQYSQQILLFKRVLAKVFVDYISKKPFKINFDFLRTSLSADVFIYSQLKSPFFYEKQLHIDLSIIANSCAIYGIDEIGIKKNGSHMLMFEPIIYPYEYQNCDFLIEDLKKELQMSFSDCEITSYPVMIKRVPLNFDFVGNSNELSPSIYQLIFSDLDIGLLRVC